nr:potassium-transporting ATPase subunit F [Neoroseomonas nitratireducens]
MRVGRIAHGAFTPCRPTPPRSFGWEPLDARPSPAGARRRSLRPDGGLPGRLRTGVSPVADLILAGVVTGGLFLYLLWALLRPEDL